MSLTDLQAREAAHFIPVVNRHPVALVEGQGSLVRDTEGREYTDLMAGWGVTCIGHCHPTLAAAIADQASRLMQTTNIFYTLPQLDLIDKLAELAPGSLNRSFLTNCGTEAVEGALKVAHRANGRPKFISTLGAFHGRSLGALSVNGSAKHREPYKALMQETVQIPFGDAGAAAAAIDAQTCAIIVEPVQGEGGVHVPVSGYMTELRKLCDNTGALLIADEVQTGIGRTGKMFGVEHDGVVPDIMTLGKGLGGGFPVAAFLVTEEVAKTVQVGDHGTTFGGNPLACAAANAVLRVVEEEKLVERSASLGAKLAAHLRAYGEANREKVELVRGLGLLQGLVLRDAKQAATIPARALQAGVIVNVTGGNVVRFFPPLNIPEDQLFEAVDVVLSLV